MAARIKNIRDYIHEKDQRLGAWIDEHITDDGMFAAPVTFILPEEAVRKRIVESANPEDGINILKSYVIPGMSLKRYAAFMPNGDTIITYADHILDVRHVDSQGVRVGSAEIRADAMFGNNEQCSVYYASGELPTSGEVPEVSGGRQHRRIRGRAERSSKRHMLCEFVERRYKTYLYKRALFPRELKCVNPYLEFVVSLFNYLKSLQGDKAKYGKFLAYLLDIDPAVSFYILLEPYHLLTPGFQYLIPDDIIEGYRYARVYGNVFDQYMSLFDKLEYSAAFLEQKRSDLTLQQSRFKSAGTEITKTCDNQYQALFNHSSVLRDYPQGVLDLVGSWQKKRSQDILRFCFPHFYNVFTRDGEGGEYIHVSEATISKEFCSFRNHVRMNCCHNLFDIKMRALPVREPVTMQLSFCKSHYFLYSAPLLNEIRDKSCGCNAIYEVLKAANGEFDRLKGLRRDLEIYKECGLDPGFALPGGVGPGTAPVSIDR